MKLFRTTQRLILLAGVLWSGCTKAPPTPQGQADQVVRAMIEAMGGEQAFASRRYLGFDFIVEKGGRETSHHAHLWDRWTGRYRLEGSLRDGSPYQALMQDIQTRRGIVFRNDSLLSGDARQAMLEYAYDRFINDTYWLLMPWKMMDSGVYREYGGTDSTGQQDDILHLSFGHVGLTPGDHYTVYVNPTSHRVDRWQFVLEDSENGDYAWTHWQPYDGLWFSDTKISADQQHVIRTTRIRFPESVDDRVFDDRTAGLP